MLEVDARVDDAEQHARAVVFLRQSFLECIIRERQRVVDICGLAGLVCEWAALGRDADARHLSELSHLLKPVDGNHGGQQGSAEELTLYLDAQRLQLADGRAVAHADKSRYKLPSVDVDGADDGPVVLGHPGCLNK